MYTCTACVWCKFSYCRSIKMHKFKQIQCIKNRNITSAIVGCYICIRIHNNMTHFGCGGWCSSRLQNCSCCYFICFQDHHFIVGAVDDDFWLSIFLLRLTQIVNYLKRDLIFLFNCLCVSLLLLSLFLAFDSLTLL